MQFIETAEDLRAIYGEASQGALRKQLASLDEHARKFLSLSPFAVIGSQAPNGMGDVTPRGDQPGFTVALDDHTIAMPDRPGNARLDTLDNILRNPAVGLIFMIPGMNETLRINGMAKITADPNLCERLAVNGKPAKSVIVIAVHEVYMHCAKAYIRSKLWKPETWPERSSMPSLGEILRDQIAHSVAAEQIDESLAENYRKELW